MAWGDAWAASNPAPKNLGRTKIWELSSNLHCSIIGTCLTGGELRQFLHTKWATRIQGLQTIMPYTQRLYQLVRQKGAVADHTFQIKFLDPGIQAYAFTFG